MGCDDGRVGYIKYVAWYPRWYLQYDTQSVCLYADYPPIRSLGEKDTGDLFRDAIRYELPTSRLALACCYHGERYSADRSRRDLDSG